MHGAGPHGSHKKERKKDGGRPINSRRKGSRNELALVRFLQGRGLTAEKISRTGYTGSDLSVPLLGRDLKCKVKVRANGFQRLYDWLTGADLLILRADRREPLVVLPLRLAAEIAAAAEGRSPLEGHLPP